MRNILILKYWAKKAKFHDISRYLADHVKFNHDQHNFIKRSVTFHRDEMRHFVERKTLF
jgi:hypothetical protein